MYDLATVLLLALLAVYAFRFWQEKAREAPRNYDVFLSFRGGDTRTGFTDFLYNSLVAAGVRVFRDDDSLPVGKEIDPELLRAIRSCRIAIPIISEQYAQSKSCLRELTEIMECHRKQGQSVFPVFYKVNVYDVRHQLGNFKKALSEHERQCSSEELQKWVTSLFSVTWIRGWISYAIANGHEGELVKLVVAKVSSELKTTWIERLPLSPILASNYPIRSGCFGEKMLRHRDLVDGSTYERWEQALKEVGSYKGWVSEKIANGHEGVLVKQVVKEVSRLLKNAQTHDPPFPSTEY
ncbi:hypothetical protein NL676_013335 [Syzygium grande]|nr:hypothetical protein NL676_013335 [Syzygium grande]